MQFRFKYATVSFISKSLLLHKSLSLAFVFSFNAQRKSERALNISLQLRPPITATNQVKHRETFGSLLFKSTLICYHFYLFSLRFVDFSKAKIERSLLSVLIRSCLYNLFYQICSSTACSRKSDVPLLHQFQAYILILELSSLFYLLDLIVFVRIVVDLFNSYFLALFSSKFCNTKN